MKKLKTAEKNCRRDLAMQIALCVTRGEYAEIDMGNHGQVILVSSPTILVGREAGFSLGMGQRKK